MRISDWSSDVCSSDLNPLRTAAHDLFGELDRLNKIMLGVEVEQRHEPAIDFQRPRMIAAFERRDQFDRYLRERIGEAGIPALGDKIQALRSDEHTSERQSLLRTTYAVFSL